MIKGLHPVPSRQIKVYTTLQTLHEPLSLLNNTHGNLAVYPNWRTFRAGLGAKPGSPKYHGSAV